jgi:hypothetical protein
MHPAASRNTRSRSTQNVSAAALPVRLPYLEQTDSQADRISRGRVWMGIDRCSGVATSHANVRTSPPRTGNLWRCKCDAMLFDAEETQPSPSSGRAAEQHREPSWAGGTYHPSRRARTAAVVPRYQPMQCDGAIWRSPTARPSHPNQPPLLLLAGGGVVLRAQTFETYMIR